MFFNNWFFTNGYIDLDLKKGTKSANGYTFDIKNIGGYVIPFDVKITYADGSTESFHQTPVVWEHNQKEISINIKTSKTIRSANLDGGIFMDADESNNSWTAK